MFVFPNIVIIIQARMTSSRLPGKVMLNLNNETVLAHVIQRCKKSRFISKVVVAFPDTSESQPIEVLCRELNVDYFAGSESDVLSRYYFAAKMLAADIVIRITSDCPLIDYSIIDAMLIQFLSKYSSDNKFDYYSNVVLRTLPRGFDVEIFTFKALEIAFNKAHDPIDREHVTRYLYTNKIEFNIGNYSVDSDFSLYRLTLDEKADYLMFEKLFQALDFEGIKEPLLYEILYILNKYPDIYEINKHIEQKGK
nr:NTP transferase domain-containing protein [Pigmentibacter ruber]